MDWFVIRFYDCNGKMRTTMEHANSAQAAVNNVRYEFENCKIFDCYARTDCWA
jgi:hypothetical protein